MIRTAGVAAMVLLLLTTASASAATTKTVKMVNYAFKPANLSVSIGDTVQWHNASNKTHTATSDVNFLWSSVSVSPGATSSTVTFSQAGTFLYHDSTHPTQMHGKIKVPMSVSGPQPGTTNQFTLTLGSATAPPQFTHDIQYRVNGGTWQVWANSSGPTTTFQSSGVGTYEFRTRMTYLLSGATSGWSPLVSIQIS